MVRFALAATVCLLAQPCFAQTSATPLTPPGSAGSGTITPPPAQDPGLNRGAVVRPGNPDPAINVTPPQVGITPVVPAPGTTDNGAPVIPK